VDQDPLPGRHRLSAHVLQDGLRDGVVAQQRARDVMRQAQARVAAYRAVGVPHHAERLRRLAPPRLEERVRSRRGDRLAVAGAGRLDHEVVRAAQRRDRGDRESRAGRRAVHRLRRHAESIGTARRRAAAAGVEDRVTFEVADAVAYSGTYDVVAFFDALHDLGDPVGAARRACAALAPDRVCVVVEQFAGDTIEDNLTPIGRYFYGMSTPACVTCSSGAASGPSSASPRRPSTSSSRHAVSRSSRRTPAGGPP